MKPNDSCTIRQFCTFYNLSTSDVTALLKKRKEQLGEVLGWHSDGPHCKKKPLYRYEAILQTVSGFYPHVGFAIRARAFLVGQKPTDNKVNKRLRGFRYKAGLRNEQMERQT